MDILIPLSILKFLVSFDNDGIDECLSFQWKCSIVIEPKRM